MCELQSVANETAVLMNRPGPEARSGAKLLLTRAALAASQYLISATGCLQDCNPIAESTALKVYYWCTLPNNNRGARSGAVRLDLKTIVRV